MTDFAVGQSVLIKGFFEDVDGNPTSPDTVTLAVRAPDGTITNPANTEFATGEFHAAVVLDDDGIWRWRWEGQTGSSVAVSEGSLCSKKSIVVAA